MNRTPILLVCTIAVGFTPAFAQTPEEAFRRDIVKLLDITGSRQLGVQMANMVSASLLDEVRTSNPNVPQEMVDLAKKMLHEEFTKAFDSPDGLTPKIVDIYARYFTHDEVRGLIAFYETDLGRKMVSTLPQLMQEAGAEGQKWAQKNTPGILDRLRARLRAEGLIK